MNQQRQRCADGGKLAAHGKGHAAYACQQQRIGQRAQAGQTVQQREEQRHRAAGRQAHASSGAVSPSDSESGQTQPTPIRNVVSAWRVSVRGTEKNGFFMQKTRLSGVE